MSSEALIELSSAWKKYSKRHFFHRSIREDFINLFKRNNASLQNDEFWAIQDLSLTVHAGECVGLAGANGAGKSTLLKLIAGVTYPTQGSVIVRAKVAPMIEVGAGFHPDLTGRENIFMNGTIIGMSIREVREKLSSIIDFSGLESFIDMPVKKFSSGMHLRLGFSIALHSSADILLIDEILSVGDLDFQQKCIEAIKSIRAKKAIILVSHDQVLLERIADRICWLQKGQISASSAVVHGES